MKVKIFDCDHEKDLEDEINNFLSRINDINIIDIKFSISTMYDLNEQIYCYSAMIIYKD